MLHQSLLFLVVFIVHGVVSEFRARSLWCFEAGPVWLRVCFGGCSRSLGCCCCLFTSLLVVVHLQNNKINNNIISLKGIGEGTGGGLSSLLGEGVWILV